jgi:hypothetical protein
LLNGTQVSRWRNQRALRTLQGFAANSANGANKAQEDYSKQPDKL